MTTDVTTGSAGDCVPVDEYMGHNYTGRNFDEDRMLIERIAAALRESAVAPASLDAVADVGAGPNLYPSLLWAPFVGTSLRLIERSAAFRGYTRRVLDGTRDATIWDKFGDCVAAQGPLWTGAFDRVRRLAQVLPGSVFDLPPATYDAVSTFFVSECATDERAAVFAGIRRAVAAVRPGGLFVASHILGSTGMRQAGGRFYPAYPLTIDDLIEAYAGTGVTVSRLTSQPETRPGYTGIAVALGRIR
jgi:hypothetical protein